MTAKTFDALWALYKPLRVKGKKSECESIRLYERYLRPSLGSRVVARTTYEVIQELHNSMKATPYQANRVLSMLRPLFKYAQALRWVPPDHNPASHVRRFPEASRSRYALPHEVPKIARAVYANETASPYGCLFLWLLIFTGARPKEICDAKWEDLDGNKLTLRQHKTIGKSGRERIVVLPPIALEKLKITPPNDRTGRIIRHSRPAAVWEKIRDDIGCSDMRVYDLRHTFATYALEEGYSLDQIGESLGHRSAQTTKIYADLSIRSRQRVALDTSLAILKDMQIQDVEDDPFD